MMCILHRKAMWYTHTESSFMKSSGRSVRMWSRIHGSSCRIVNCDTNEKDNVR